MSIVSQLNEKKKTPNLWGLETENLHCKVNIPGNSYARLARFSKQNKMQKTSKQRKKKETQDTQLNLNFRQTTFLGISISHEILGTYLY